MSDGYEYDLIIRGGEIHDGDGGEPAVGDSGVRGGFIATSRQVAGPAPQETDAAGRWYRELLERAGARTAGVLPRTD